MLCSNHGKYGGGLCHCEEGWKGTECDIPETDCRVADCSGHGVCKSGVCQCQQGWKGDDCNEGINNINIKYKSTVVVHTIIAGIFLIIANYNSSFISFVNINFFQIW